MKKYNKEGVEFKIGDWVKKGDKYYQIHDIGDMGWPNLSSNPKNVYTNPDFLKIITKLPKKWAVEVTNENREELVKIRTWKLGNSAISNFITSDPFGTPQRFKFGKFIKKDDLESTYEIIPIEMLKYFLNKDIDKKLIGYKLKDETLIPVIQRLIEIESNKSYNCLIGGIKIGTGVTFIPISSPETIKILKHTKVLDFWYEPVYKEEEEISIGNLEIIFNDNYIKIGCKKITIDRIIIHL